MKKILTIIFFTLICKTIYPCNVCGGGTSDIGVLSLDGRLLFGFGLSYDKYNGTWDNSGKWIKSVYAQSQTKLLLGVAYRVSRHVQFSVSLPYAFNQSEVPGAQKNASGFSDMNISGRYEFFHEFQMKKVNGKSRIDKSLPYLAITFGLQLPTGRSIETAKNETEVTGKGYYATTLGVSLIKSIIRNRLQVTTDFSWQHSFEKTYDKYFNQPTTQFKQKPGDKFNYSLTLNYIFGSESAVSLTASGFLQSAYSLNGQSISNSDERVTNLTLAYTYYPHIQLRITPTVKFSLPGDNFGKNATGSLMLGINFAYYIPDNNLLLEQK